MAIKDNPSDWWQREKQRVMTRVFIFLLLLLLLIAYFYYVAREGKIGVIHGVNFDTSKYIAFVRKDDTGSFALYAIQADGTDLRRLTTIDNHSNKSHPAWTQDGKSLLFATNAGDNQVYQIYILGDGPPTKLTYGSGNKSDPVTAADGKTAAFITQGAVKTVTLTGDNVLQVLPPPRAGNETEGSESTGESESGPFLSASFGSDGVSIAGVQDISNQIITFKQSGPSDKQRVRAMPIDQQIVAFPAGASHPYVVAQGHEVSFAWEPTGSRLACSYTEFPMMDDKGAPIDGKNRPIIDEKTPLYPVSGIRIFSFQDGKMQAKPILAALGYSIEPKNLTWSPDGIKIVFESWRLKGPGIRENAGLVLMDITPMLDSGKYPQLDTTNLNSVQYVIKATPDAIPQNPRWSPDGKRLLYELVKSNGKRDLWVINSDGTNPFNLTKGDGDNYEGAWSPAK